MKEFIEFIKYVPYYIIFLIPFYKLFKLSDKYYKNYLQLKNNEPENINEMNINFKKAKLYYYLNYAYILIVFLAFAIYIMATSDSFHEAFLK